MIVGQGDFKYELAEGWEQLPEGWRHGDVAGVATDDQDRVYVFNRGEHPVIVYDRDGHFLRSWGEGGMFARPHGITIVRDELYLADDGNHTVRKFSLDGELLMTLGNENQPSDTGYDPKVLPATLTTIQQPSGPFNRPTRLSMAPNGQLYVSDGYGNSCVHRFSNDGGLLQSWGEPGTGQGQFNLPHSVSVYIDGRVFVCDRENDRIQIFAPEGEFLEEWSEDVTRPSDLFIDAASNVYIGEIYWMSGKVSLSGRTWPEERYASITVRDIDGRLISKFGGEVDNGDPCAPGNFTSPHGIGVDRHGDVYVGEVSQTSYQGTIYRDGCHSLQKFIRVR